MHTELKTSLDIRLAEPAIPLRAPPDRPSRNRHPESLPPAAVRGLLVLSLARPAKVSGIELELQAKAMTQYVLGAGPSRVDVTEEYKVHSASAVVFKAGPAHRPSPTRPRVQFIDGVRGAPGTSPNRVGAEGCASIDVQSPVIKKQHSSDDLNHLDVTNFRPVRTPSDVPSPCSQHSHSSPGIDSFRPIVGRSQSVASSSDPPSTCPLAPLHRGPEPRMSLGVRSPTLDISHGSPASSARSIVAMSRTSSIEAVPEDETEPLDAPAADSDPNIAYYGLSRIVTGSSGRSSEPDHRGRSRSRLSFRKVLHVFEAVKERVRPQSPSDEQDEERGRSLVKGKGKAQVTTHGVGGVADPSIADSANDKNGDGWVVFPEGIYTYPILFTIPNNSPPTMKADSGSLVWKVKAEVKRPGMFKSRMTAQKEVIVVCVPLDDDPEESEELDLEREWEGQLQYHVQITGRGVPVGGKVPFQLTITPLAKIKVHCISVYLDERTLYCTRAGSQVRTDAIRRATLLVIRQNNSNQRYSEPILPLASDDLDEFRKSPLYRFLGLEEDESEVASSLMGPGPWTIRHQLEVPGSCSILHPSNRAKRSNVMVDHTLKIVLRVEKEDGKKKLYDIVIQKPMHILSCRCTSEWMSLPSYSESLRPEDYFREDSSVCPCRTRNQAKARTHVDAADHLSPPLERFPANSNPSDSPANLTRLHERLVSGLVSERGETPPAYSERE